MNKKTKAASMSASISIAVIALLTIMGELVAPFKDFMQSLAFANKVGAVAEAEGHHPDLYVAWGKCKVEIWTHKINGLTESDFYLAAKADREFEPFRAVAG